MRMQIKVALAAMLVLAFVAVQSAGAAPATWTGKISDAMCGMSKHTGDGSMTADHDCVNKCAKGAGGKYVFVDTKDKKVYQIANQDYKPLEAHAGHTVELTGEMKGDSITVTKIVMPQAK